MATQNLKDESEDETVDSQRRVFYEHVQSALGKDAEFVARRLLLISELATSNNDYRTISERCQDLELN